jgi:virulence factor
MKKRIGIIGLGSIAQKVYLPLLTKNEKVEVVGIMSRDSNKVSRVAHQYRIPNWFTNLDDLLINSLDAVFVHASTESHYEIVTTCMSKGVSVYVDKPLSYSINESMLLNDLAEKKKMLLAVGFNRRFAPKYVEAKEWVTNGGGITSCVVQKHRTNIVNQSFVETIYDDLIHMLDLLLWLNNNNFEVLKSIIQRNSIDQLLSGFGMVGFKNSTGIFSMERSAGSDLEKVELFGNGRSAEVINLEVAKLNEKNKPEIISGYGSWDDILFRRGFDSIVNHFIDCLDKPLECKVSSSIVIPTHHLVEQVIKQAK